MSTTPTEIAAHWSVSGCAAQRARLHEARARVVQRDVAAADRRGARAAVGLEHVAVDGDLHLAQHVEVGDRAQRAADQALDLLRATRRPALLGLALDAVLGGARQHRVLGGDPAPALAAQPRRHTRLDRRGAEHVRAAELDQHGARRELGEVARERDRSEVSGLAPVAPNCHAVQPTVRPGR